MSWSSLALRVAVTSISGPNLHGEATWASTMSVQPDSLLRDEGEAYANKLREAGVPVTAVRYQGIIHDFVVLNALLGTHAAEAAINKAVGTLSTAFATA
jgi:acetyl esterase/lipase